jgi:type I restriction enzyme S subunit
VRLAEILSTVDLAIVQTQALMDKYSRVKLGLMQDLLTHGIDENGDIRNKQTHGFTLKKGIDVPDEWEVYEVGDITDHVASGVTPKGGSNVYGHSGVMLIRSQNILSGDFNLADVAFISDEINQVMKRSQLEIFDVLLNITGASVGRSHYVPENFPISNVNQHVCAIRLKNRSKEKSVFVSTFLNDFRGQVQIRRLLGASNREGLNFQQVREIRIAMPRIEENDEFQRIEQVLSSIESNIRCARVNLMKTLLLKRGLMRDLLSGRKRVNIDD